LKGNHSGSAGGGSLRQAGVFHRRERTGNEPASWIYEDQVNWKAVDERFFGGFSLFRWSVFGYVLGFAYVMAYHAGIVYSGERFLYKSYQKSPLRILSRNRSISKRNLNGLFERGRTTAPDCCIPRGAFHIEIFERRNRTVFQSRSCAKFILFEVKFVFAFLSMGINTSKLVA